MESVQAALRVFEKVAVDGPIGVSELSRQLGEPKTTVQRCLSSLHEAGWLRPVTTGGSKRRQWVVTPRIFVLNRHVDSSPHLRQIALPVMERLRAQTRETVHLCIREGNFFVQVEELDSPLPLRTSQPYGFRVPLHISSSGKAILAFLPESDRKQVLAGPLISFTEATVTDPVQLAEELAQIRKRGYAAVRGELNEGICGISAPILDPGGQPIASLSVSCPTSRLAEDQVEERGRLVRAAAREVTQALARESSVSSPTARK